MDELIGSFGIKGAGTTVIPLPLSLSKESEPPGLGMACREIAIQIDIQVGLSTWVVTLNNGQAHIASDPKRTASASPNVECLQDVSKFEVLTDDDDELHQDVDCFDCEDAADSDSDFKHPDEYVFDRKKMLEYGNEEFIIPVDYNFGKS